MKRPNLRLAWIAALAIAFAAGMVQVNQPARAASAPLDCATAAGQFAMQSALTDGAAPGYLGQFGTELQAWWSPATGYEITLAPPCSSWASAFTEMGAIVGLDSVPSTACPKDAVVSDCAAAALSGLGSIASLGVLCGGTGKPADCQNAALIRGESVLSSACGSSTAGDCGTAVGDVVAAVDNSVCPSPVTGASCAQAVLSAANSSGNPTSCSGTGWQVCVQGLVNQLALFAAVDCSTAAAPVACDRSILAGAHTIEGDITSTAGSSSGASTSGSAIAADPTLLQGVSAALSPICGLGTMDQPSCIAGNSAEAAVTAGLACGTTTTEACVLYDLDSYASSVCNQPGSTGCAESATTDIDSVVQCVERSLTGILGCPTVGVLSTGGNQQSYNRGNATNYANEWATGWNTRYPLINEDCTNFVSQALLAGGDQMLNATGDTNSDNEWWMQQEAVNFWQYTRSWAFVPNFLTFFQNSGRGSFVDAVDGNSGNNLGSGVRYGDVIFYDWDYYSNIDGFNAEHSSIEVNDFSNDMSGNGWHGSLVDAHTTDRYQVYWTLEPYNSQAFYTRVEAWAHTG